MVKNKPILCLDFDGVIHSYTSGWKGAAEIPDPPVPGAIAFIYLAVQSFEVHIFSSRSHQPGGIEAMQAWLARWFREWASENAAWWPTEEWCRYLLELIHWPVEKPPAMVTIDDRAITFTGTWPLIDDLLKFKPWNKP